MVKHTEKCFSIQNHNFLGQTPKGKSKMLFKLEFFHGAHLLLC